MANSWWKRAWACSTHGGSGFSHAPSWTVALLSASLVLAQTATNETEASAGLFRSTWVKIVLPMVPLSWRRLRKPPSARPGTGAGAVVSLSTLAISVQLLVIVQVTVHSPAAVSHLAVPVMSVWVVAAWVGVAAIRVVRPRSAPAVIAAARGSRFFSTSAHFGREKRGAPALSGRRTPCDALLVDQAVKVTLRRRAMKKNTPPATSSRTATPAMPPATGPVTGRPGSSVSSPPPLPPPAPPPLSQ